MLNKDQYEIIDQYVPEEYFDRVKLENYLKTHDIVGNEVFQYCVKDSKGSTLGISYSNYLDDTAGFNPIDTALFLRRIPFYFYVPDVKKKQLGNLDWILRSVIKDNKDADPAKIEQIYKDLEMMFYEVGISLDTIFNYMMDQYLDITGAPWNLYARYIKLCRILGWKDYAPKVFISAFNYALEASDLASIVYEVDEWLMGDYYFRKGNQIQFNGRFPVDKNGKPVMRWIGIDVSNPGEITYDGEKSRQGVLTIELLPDTVIKVLNICNDHDDGNDYWYQVYAGPRKMLFDYEELKRKRKQLHYKQQDVAEAIGASVRTYQKWENGETVPDGYNLLKLMNWLDIPDAQLMVKYVEEGE